MVHSFLNVFVTIIITSLPKPIGVAWMQTLHIYCLCSEDDARKIITGVTVVLFVAHVLRNDSILLWGHSKHFTLSCLYLAAVNPASKAWCLLTNN